MGGKRGDVKVLLGGGGGVNFVHVAVSWQLAECCPRNVQTFFCWKCRSGLRCVPRLRRYGHVSILLLLEMPQWLVSSAKMFNIKALQTYLGMQM